MATVIINCGICGFVTRVVAKRIDRQNVSIVIDSECPNLKKAVTELKVVQPYHELFGKFHESDIYRIFLNAHAHPTCLVPVGVLKGIEVAAELALPKDSYIQVIP